MIDTDKYEGHLTDLTGMAETIEQHRASYALLTDAPLLLKEVKRLRKKLNLIRNTVYYDIEENFTEKQAHDPVIIDIMKKIHEVIE